MLNTRAKFCPSSWLVPICSALPSRIMASHVQVVVAPEKRSRSVLRPVRMGMARTLTMKSSYTSWRMRSANSRASASVAWAVWPSCHRNSVVRRKSRGRSSQRTTLAHWLIRNGRSR